MISRICDKCGLEKSQRLWYKDISVCSDCNAKAKGKRNRNSDKQKAATKNRIKKFRLNSPHRVLYTYAKARAKRKGIDFTITLQDLEKVYPNPPICPVLGVTFQHGQGKKGGSYNSPSLDRIDSNKGYVPDNIRVISWRANSLKKNMTFQEAEAIYLDFKKLSGSSE